MPSVSTMRQEFMVILSVHNETGIYGDAECEHNETGAYGDADCEHKAT